VLSGENLCGGKEVVMAKERVKEKESAEVIAIHPEMEKRLPQAQYDLFTGEAKVLPVVVDRSIISHINLGAPIGMEGGLLDAETRKSVSQRILERLETREPYQGKKYQIRSIIQIQARNLAAFLKGERKYRPFSFKW
jgi:hypothetical protein